jgi:hypothetical protein
MNIGTCGKYQSHHLEFVSVDRVVQRDPEAVWGILVERRVCHRREIRSNHRTVGVWIRPCIEEHLDPQDVTGRRRVSEQRHAAWINLVGIAPEHQAQLKPQRITARLVVPAQAGRSVAGNRAWFRNERRVGAHW